MEDMMKEGESVTPPPATGRETILLVEDDPPIRQLMRKMLETQGYRLLEARNGEEAVTVARQYQEPIHLLLTDVVMPRMGGFALAERVVSSRPGTKVLYLSGYADDSVAVRRGLKESARPFLLKPFTQTELAQQIRTALVAPEPTKSEKTPLP